MREFDGGEDSGVGTHRSRWRAPQPPVGFGFRIGFLGLLHMEIIQERLEREYDLDLIVTAPSVVYEVETEKGEKVVVDSPAKMPEGRKVTSEPYVRLEVLTPSEYNGKVMELGQERRGQLIDIKYMTEDKSSIVYELPLAEVSRFHRRF